MVEHLKVLISRAPLPVLDSRVCLRTLPVLTIGIVSDSVDGGLDSRADGGQSSMLTHPAGPHHMNSECANARWRPGQSSVLTHPHHMNSE